MQSYLTKRRSAPAKDNRPQTQPITTNEMLHMSNAGAPQPMSPALREKFEPGFSADFSNIRISRGHIPEELGVQAVAKGTDILLDSSAGMDVLGHELAHVVQQAQGRVAGGYPVVENAGLEHEADVMGARVASGLTAEVGSQNGFGGETMSISPMSSASAPAQCKSKEEKEAEKAAKEYEKQKPARVRQMARSQREEFLKDKYYRGNIYQSVMQEGNHANISEANLRRFVERNLDRVGGADEAEVGRNRQEMYSAFESKDRQKMGGYAKKEFQRQHAAFSDPATAQMLQDLESEDDETFMKAYTKMEPLELEIMPLSDLFKNNWVSLEEAGIDPEEFQQYKSTSGAVTQSIYHARRRAKGLRTDDPSGVDYMALGTPEERQMKEKAERSPNARGGWDTPAPSPTPTISPKAGNRYVTQADLPQSGPGWSHTGSWRHVNPDSYMGIDRVDMMEDQGGSDYSWFRRTPVPTPASTPAPEPEKKKKGFWSRLFGR